MTLRDPRPPALFALAASLAAPGCVINLATGPSGPAEEKVLIAADSLFTFDKIAVIDVAGEISFGEDASLLTAGEENTVDAVYRRLLTAEDDDRVRAVVLRIDSPGGGVTASDLIHREVTRFKERTGRPVVACLMDTAASGGYYVACAADEIVAHPTTVTGSIGVIMQHFEVHGLLDKLGIAAGPITSGAKKDLGSIYRPMAPDERAVLQSIIDEMYERFVRVVAEGRGLAPEQVRKVADGRVYTATQALRHGLVDQVGYLSDALARARALAGIDDAKVVMYKRSGEPSSTIYARGDVPPAPLLHLDLADLAGGGHPRFAYVWRPEGE